MGVVSWRRMWVESMGVASGYGCKEVYTVLDIKRVENAFNQCILSQSYFMLLTNKTYQHDP